MEYLKRQREAAAAQPAAPAASAVATTPVPAATDPAAGKQTSSSQAVLVGTPATPASAETSPVYTRWWFWTLVGAAVVAGGVGVAAGGGVESGEDVTQRLVVRAAIGRVPVGDDDADRRAAGSAIGGAFGEELHPVERAFRARAEAARGVLVVQRGVERV